ncbi:MAG: recombinase family protein [Clostridia bacterium]|nr:recombinase family protein [Clostridia bacterium]
MRKLSDNELRLLLNIKQNKQIKDKLNTVVYARKSSEDEFQTALDSQIAQCEKLIEMNSDFLRLDKKNIYSEENKSGMFAYNRDKFQEIISKVENGEVDCVVVHTLDRFSRRLEDTQKYLELLKKNNCMLICTDSPMEENAMGEFMRNIIGSVSQFFVRQTAEKTYRSLENKARDCRITGGIPNFGYKYEGDHYTRDIEESIGIEIMFNGIVDGKTYTQIIDELESFNIKTRAGKKFCETTIKSILQNVKYCGTYTYNRKDGKKKKNRVLLGEYEEIRIENGITEPLIDVDTFNKVQEILKGRNQCRRRSNAPHHLLSGLIKCSCGQVYVGNCRQHRKGGNYYTYICKGRTKDKSCNATEINANHLEDFAKSIVLEVVNGQIRNKQFDKTLIIEYLKKQNTKLKCINREIRDLNSAIDKQIDLMGATQNKLIIQKLTEKVENLTNTLSNKEKLQVKYKQEYEIIEAKINKIRNGIELTREELFINPFKTRELFHLLIKEIVIDGDNIEIELK